MARPIILLVLGIAALASAKINNRYKRTTQSVVFNALEALEEQWFTQYLDNYDITNDNTWKQRYFVTDEYYKPGGPAFLILEGEWEASSEKMKYYASVAYAKKLNAIVFLLEHRFYGKSRPTSDLSESNLRYLSSDQALIDAAFFISGMNAKYKLPEETKWIVFGSSYSANLAVWMRDKFSHLVYASVAYSAPVLAKLNFNDYKTVVRDSIAEYSQECANKLKMAQLQIKKAIEEDEDLVTLQKKYYLCDPVVSSKGKDIETLFGKLAANLDEIVQYNLTLDINIETACSIMCIETAATLVDRYADINALILNEEDADCLDYKYYRTVDMMTDVSWEGSEATSGAIQWEYQLCSEFGYFQTSDKSIHLLAEDIPISHYIQRCKDFYGDKFTKKSIHRGVKRTNTVFGGKQVKATRVAYINGDADPWNKLGITSTMLDESPAIMVEGASHSVCTDGADEYSPDTVKAACDKIEEIVTKWVEEE